MGPVDEYCERLGPGLWAEPLNASTSLAFLVAAAIVWPAAKGQATTRLLALIMGLIGIGSGLFHTVATRAAGLADVLPIVAFILVYVFAASRDLLGLSPRLSLVAAAAFLPYAALTVPLWSMIPGLGSSAGYAPVPVLILAYAWLLRDRAPAAARGLKGGAALLTLSLAFRTLDGPLCPRFPAGTHFLWHLTNAWVLAHMIAVLVRHGQGLRGGAGLSK